MTIFLTQNDFYLCVCVSMHARILLQFKIYRIIVLYFFICSNLTFRLKIKNIHTVMPIRNIKTNSEHKSDTSSIVTQNKVKHTGLVRKKYIFVRQIWHVLCISQLCIRKIRNNYVHNERLSYKSNYMIVVQNKFLSTTSCIA